MNAQNDALLTDLYELTMLQAYRRERMDAQASFELFVRRLPGTRNFLLACGLEQALEFLESLRFSKQDLTRLEETGLFEEPFLDWLSTLRFEGRVDAPPEGTVLFADEPLLRVTASLPQAQLVETRLLNILNFQTAVASKAARCVLAARGRSLVEFGLRRAQGGEGGLWASRAAWLAGFDATSNVLAGLRYGVPVSGTMAHSYVQAHDEEAEAFERFAEANPRRTVLLLDTYDVDRAAREAVRLGRDLAARGRRLAGVRLDSGDVAAQAERVRRVLDSAGLHETGIFVSGGLDEERIAELVEAGAPIDGFGVGTRLSCSADAPYLDCAYKLVEYAGRGRRKRSEGKSSWPGKKQVWRRRDDEGRLAGDLVALEEEAETGEPLLELVMREGRRVRRAALAQARLRARRELDALPPALRELEPAAPYPVRISKGVRGLAARLDLEAPAGRRS